MRIAWERRSLATGAIAAAAGPLLGVGLFFSLFDPRLLDPGWYQWLMRNDGAQSFLGWHFFRDDPWYLPPGAGRSYGQELASSIVFTDSIPLLALGFKLIGAALPQKFQYVGAWVLACFALQGAFAWLLSGTVATRIPQRLAITALLVASPIMVDRALGHYALMGHWLLLAALYLYLRPASARDTVAWATLACVAALVHAYLLYMVLAIWVAYGARRLAIDRDFGPGDAVRHGAVVAGALAITMWVAGYFVLPSSAMGGGAEYFGRFAANLNVLWNPQWGSRFLPGLPVIPGSELEGFNYLGAGGLALLAAGVAAWIVNPARVGSRRWLPLAVVVLALTLLSLSHKLAWGDTVVFTIPLPEAVLQSLAIFRASGRFLWVAWYALIVIAAAMVVRRWPRAATAVLASAAVLQAMDLSPRFGALRGHFREHFVEAPATRQPTLQSPFWAEAAQRYRHVALAPVVHIPRNWEPIALYAADHDMTINTGYFARVDHVAVASSNERTLRELAEGTLRKDTLYVVWDPPAVPLKERPEDLVETIDGFRVVAPEWRNAEAAR